MAIYIDEPNFQTIVQCDHCDVTAATDRPDGVVPVDWATGQLWIDLSVSEQRQTPICFCPDCSPAILSSTSLRIAHYEEPSE